MRQVAVCKDVLLKVIAGDLAKVNLSITYACNYRCKTCNIWRLYLRNPNLKNQELTLSDYDQLFEENSDLIWVSLTGGEPFLRSDLPEIAISALENLKKLRVMNLATNGSMPNRIEECVERLIDAAKGRAYVFVEVSLDGKEHVHAEIRGVKDAYRAALETFSRLRNLKAETESESFDVKFEYTISKFNAGMLRSTIDELRDAGVPVGLDDFVITFAHNSFFYNNLRTEVKPETDTMLDEVSWFLERYPRGHFFDRVTRSYLKMSPRYFSGGWRPPCVAGEYSCFLDPFGNVYPCITMDYRLGNLKKEGFSLREMLGDYRTQEFRQKVRPSCSTCWTSCEAYQTIIFNFPRFLKNLL